MTNTKTQIAATSLISWLATAALLVALVPTIALSDRIEQLYNYGDQLRDRGRYQEAIKQLEAAAALMVDSPRHRLGVPLLGLLGDTYTDLQDYASAERVYRAYHQAKARIYGEESVEAATALQFVAQSVDMAQGEEAALPIYLERLRIVEKRLGKNHAELIGPLRKIGVAQKTLGQYRDAEKYIVRARELARTKPGVDRITLGRCAFQLAGLYRDTGRIGLAEPLYLESIRMFETDPNYSRQYAHTRALFINELAYLYWKLQQYDKAEHVIKQAIVIVKPTREQKPYYYSLAMNTLGLIYQDQKKLDLAENAYEEAIKFGRRIRSTIRPTSAYLCNLATVYQYRSKYDEAEKLLQEAMDEEKKMRGEETPSYIQPLGALASLRRSQGRFDEAVKLAKKSIELSRKMGRFDFGSEVTHELLGRVYWDTKQFERALDAFDRQRRIIRDHVSSVLPTLPEHEQLKFGFDADLVKLNLALNMAWRAQEASVQRAAEVSAEWLLNGKSTLAESMAQRVLAAREATDPRFSKDVEEWFQLRRQIANLPLGGSEKMQAFRQKLIWREGELAAKIGRQATGDHKQDAWVKLDRIRQAIPDDAVFVDIFKVRLTDNDVLNDDAPSAFDYFAWVIPSEGKGGVRIVRLGDFQEIEDLVFKTRSLLSKDAVESQVEERSEADYRVAAKPLSELLLKPLAESIAGVKHLLICPDGALWLTPWSALPVDGDKYLVHDYKLTFVNSGRDLLNQNDNQVSGNLGVVFADPDFDLDPQVARREAQRQDLPTNLLAVRGPIRDSSIRWDRLPGTATEAAWITSHLTEFLGGSEPTVLTQQQALELAAKSVWQPRVLVVSSHGFFLENEPRITGGLPVNPMLRCGVVLAGANRAAGANDEDGILTGMEIIGMDLRGTELVVLSACETALGDLHVGQGVAGLGQAFQLAGARSLIASLWQIPDKQTAELMDIFFAQLAKEEDKSAALQEAQLEIIRRRRDSQDAAHPYYWAAFTQSGLWDTPRVNPPRERPKLPKGLYDVVVTAPTEIRTGNESWARVTSGQRLVVHKEQGNWLWVAYPGRTPFGWISRTKSARSAAR